jgi:hypothetical protein|tara:strand:+ start:283 stop:765 length:483 start_codon:yes stop_codon:yes gene_type:complete
MARLTSFGGATLTVTLKENLTIDKRDYGGQQIMEIASIVDVTRRLVTVTTTEAVIATFAAAIGPGAYIAADVMYLRFTNLDDTNFVTLTLRNQDNDEVAVKLDAGKSFILCGDNSGGMADMFNATQDADAGSDTDLGDLTNIQADANTGSVDLEMYIACK